MSEANKSLVRRLIEETINKGNFKVMDEILSTEYVYREPTAGEKRGRAGYQEIVTMYRNAFPDIKLTIEEQIAEGDKVVTRTSGSGTHRGELFGTAPTGKRVSSVSGICVTRIANGKVVEDNLVYDALGLMRQLGVVAAPIAKAA
ncbi:MAG TPA: ester cyclase [Candidatus Acidoferrales bacterium]|nr:ester cyclase [Candidatus Acidoferrales bacterium]